MSKIISKNKGTLYKLIFVRILYLIIARIRYKVLIFLKNMILNNGDINKSNEIIMKIIGKDNTYYSSIKENVNITNQISENTKLFNLDERTIEKSLLHSLDTINKMFMYYGITQYI